MINFYNVENSYHQKIILHPGKQIEHSHLLRHRLKSYSNHT
jgi:hypothetical protein